MSESVGQPDWWERSRLSGEQWKLDNPEVWKRIDEQPNRPDHWKSARLAQEKWKHMNRERYLEQKRALASRSEYRARRRDVYTQRREDVKDADGGLRDVSSEA